MDDPIQSAADDLLRRREFARHLAGVVDRIGTLPNSTVVGLVGPWGSGKTSVINLMGQDLQPTWRVSRFDPWESGDVGSLIQGFFAAISSALPDGDSGRRARSILESRATAALPLLALIPYAGTPVKDMIGQIQERSRQLRSSEHGLQQLGRALQDAGRKVLVVVDDVDRLLPDELLSLFKAVRLLGRIPHAYYLLAYDERTLLDILQQTLTARGPSLELTVQVLEEHKDQFDSSSPLTRRAAEAALDAVVASLREGDSAPMEPVAGYLSFAESHSTIGVVSDAIAQGPHMHQWTLEDLAARLVSRASMSGGPWKLRDLNVEMLARLLPPDALREAGAIAAPEDAPIDPLDHSWRNRRRFARARLAAALAQSEYAPLPDLPTIRRQPESQGAVQRCRPGQVHADPDPYDLAIRVAVQRPDDGRELADVSGEYPSQMHGVSRDSVLQRLLEEAAFTRWFRSGAAMWDISGRPTWIPEGANAGEESTFVLRPDAGAGRKPPVRLRAYVRTGWTGPSRPGVLMVLDVAFNLLELEADRRSGGVRHATECPAPAALTVEEVHAAATAALGAVDAAAAAYEELVGARVDAPGHAAMFLASGQPLDRTIDLSRIPTIPGGHVPQTGRSRLGDRRWVARSRSTVRTQRRCLCRTC